MGPVIWSEASLVLTLVFCGLSAHIEGCRVAANTSSPLSRSPGCRSPLPTVEKPALFSCRMNAASSLPSRVSQWMQEDGTHCKYACRCCIYKPCGLATPAGSTPALEVQGAGVGPTPQSRTLYPPPFPVQSQSAIMEGPGESDQSDVDV